MALLTRAIESELQAMRASYGEEDPIAQEVRAARSKEAMPASVHRLSHILTSPTPTTTLHAGRPALRKQAA